MEYTLDTARKYVAELDNVRFEQALMDSSSEFQYVFQLVSLLLHLNHPLLPAYHPHCPVGIAQFSLSVYQRQFLLNYLPDSVINEVLTELDYAHIDPVIESVYVMGSVSTITQTSFSDLDIWVCHREDLDYPSRRSLQEKMQLLRTWAEQFRVDLNLFLMDQQRFRYFQQVETINDEHCGSSQHVLLLEEFYRSSIRLAGKPLLWLHIYTEEEKDYEQTVERLVAEGKINPKDWVDFGGLGQLSANEYFGATLWLLNKGIEAPYKSALKLLLLEVYSYEYPNSQLIASDFKKRLHNGEAVEGLDPYIAVLEKVTEYLTTLNDFKRLEFVRHCFYLKSSENILHATHKSWRVRLLENLAKEWKWTKEETDDLNNRPFWKIKRVKQNYALLMRMLMQSYRNLVNFGRKYCSSVSIVSQDIYILSRKLYAAFEILPNKINLFNLQISQDLSEKHLTLVEVQRSNVHKLGWYLINQAPVINELSKFRYVEYAENLTKLVAHAYFNGLLTTSTKLHITSPNVSLRILRQFVSDLRLSLSVDAPPVSNKALEHNYEICDIFLAVNVSKDPTKKLPNNHKIVVQQSDLFSFGIKEENLVGSIDLIYRNSWNEIHTHHFSGSNAILLALKVLLSKTQGNLIPVNSLNVFCYSYRYTQSLQREVYNLINYTLNIWENKSDKTQMIQQLRVAGKTWQLFFAGSHVNVQEIKNKDEHITQSVTAPCRTEETVVKKSKDINSYPLEIDNFASEGFLQFFFEDNRDGSFNVYILDELNHLEIYHHCDGMKGDKINEINQLYALSGVDGQDNPYKIVQTNFNYPQFYQLLMEGEGQIRIIPYESDQYNGYQK